MLVRIRKDATREEFEHRYSGGFTRIFPVDDKVRRENYAKLLADAFSTFLSSRAGSLQQEVDRVYKNKYRVCLQIQQWQQVSNMLSHFKVHSHVTSVFAFFFDLCRPILENAMLSVNTIACYYRTHS